ncbi:hypothetical protein HQ865_19625 [Mucilaginibacter mali]|uniref:Uncharacterized protein n=1 Tax=Mucilaginibacter mali TaxID=2740462 RepID=A0A7D4UEL5_9SPHI|nr:hypothetical protein [Mucilaginibacter mali]QKJ31879.1 hypothetical protein HQ865_19625 [Mucilaginibacter mali]
MELTRYWFEFEYKTYSELPIGLAMGCGLTAYNFDDAIHLLQQKVFSGKLVAPIKKANRKCGCFNFRSRACFT